MSVRKSRGYIFGINYFDLAGFLSISEVYDTQKLTMICVDWLGTP